MLSDIYICFYPSIRFVLIISNVISIMLCYLILNNSISDLRNKQIDKIRHNRNMFDANTKIREIFSFVWICFVSVYVLEIRFCWYNNNNISL